LKAHPECQLGDEKFVATEVTDPDEYARLFKLAEQVFAGYGDYRVKTAAIGYIAKTGHVPPWLNKAEFAPYYNGSGNSKFQIECLRNIPQDLRRTILGREDSCR
jgi:hypothetical protein